MEQFNPNNSIGARKCYPHIIIEINLNIDNIAKEIVKSTSLLKADVNKKTIKSVHYKPNKQLITSLKYTRKQKVKASS